jgi:putative hydrolase of the HAD superfamily
MGPAPQSKISAVIFDFGGVLCFPPSEAQWQEAAAFCEANRVEFEAAFWADRDAYDAGANARAYWRGVGRSLGLEFADDTIDGLLEREIQFWSRFDHRVLHWAEDLRAAGYRTGILSNLPRPLGQRLRALPGFLEHFDEVTFSYELGIVKPDLAIYRRAMAGLQRDPAEALFLDDRAANIEGARAAGLIAEPFTTWEDFLVEMPWKYGLPVARP